MKALDLRDAGSFRDTLVHPGAHRSNGRTTGFSASAAKCPGQQPCPSSHVCTQQPCRKGADTGLAELFLPAWL